MSDNPSSKKIDFIDFYIREGLRFSEDPNYITDVSKYLLNALKFNDTEIEKLVEITVDVLQEILNKNKIKSEKIQGFQLDKNLNGSAKYVDFFIEDNHVTSRFYTK